MSSDDYEEELPIASTSNLNHQNKKQQTIIINGVLTEANELSGGRVKKFQCTFQGCDKRYTRPVRLEEHMRTHTGERPFKCPHCPSSFGRDSHLKAHVRTHANEEDKKYSCEECDKKFWTNQHLKKHVEIIHRGKTYDCTECEESFKKHNLLRTHIAEVHSTPGTDPFQCDFEGCGKSFKQSVHLKAHQKTHDPSRYLCSHPACLLLPLPDRQFTTWSSLQKHHKITHPPTCPYPECQGKTFTTNRGLKGHLEVHEDRLQVEELNEVGVEDAGIKKKRMRGRGRKRKRISASEVEGEGRKGKSDYEETADETVDESGRERGGGGGWSKEDGEGSEWEERMDSERDERMEWDRNGKKRVKVNVESGWPCVENKCKRRFKSAGALENHVALKHSDLPPTITSPRLPIASTFQIPIQIPSTSTSTSSTASKPKLTDLPEDNISLLNLITGFDYPSIKSTRSNPTASTTATGSRKFKCPYPLIMEIAERLDPDEELQDETDDDVMPGLNGGGVGGGAVGAGGCAYRFKRVYDVERHLRSYHGVVVDKEKLEGWMGDGEDE